PGERGGAPAVSRRVRAADLGARAHRAGPEAPQARRRRVGVHRARLGRAATCRHGTRPEDGGAARPAPAGAPELGLGPADRARRSRVIFEVFRQERKGQPFQHAGSVEAPDLAFAEVYAADLYGRRGESNALWLAPRESVHEID